ncbi:MAG: alkyl hydroperoxide reductase [Flavobacteriaceae bacterium CG_4_8_14_3_um_filter_34_10]|nr:redoxin family protein [Flavobacteriia bacterium]PIQ17560.1 MAG: alkyl hydroperoxide reductase [Flavobacteriaceae bacterium CG18_big_fil_WC_8_21_14_2_50_34_36]PIV49712.1 MAG: alkyl hydroperoxide reductase [Flavobacteriaceae bacterium CG02_land_8_20_14_3_00_34_13]PIX08894.1 MAG: alkyl hydroperoxide reductase [Flavobacteriaceae bacterium CG_4_8_14_3_um_filter_34_10]PIZ07190.1 MAG: alkyl hydroperoxide reductase [Flavobacteriaceae bacterium CG_4_10_14_0_8_um_filter_34_31]PJC07844.1 MAG: alkyl h
MRIPILILFLSSFLNINAQDKVFSSEALNDNFISENGNEIAFSKILKEHKGKTVFIDIWATWCRDCIEGMPGVKALQKNNKEVVFIYLSLDKNTKIWKKGIQKYKLKGNHYFIQSGWKGPFCSNIELNWIPRYLIINPEGKISLYKAITTDEQKLKKILQ